MVSIAWGTEYKVHSGRWEGWTVVPMRPLSSQERRVSWVDEDTRVEIIADAQGRPLTRGMHIYTCARVDLLPLTIKRQVDSIFDRQFQDC